MTETGKFLENTFKYTGGKIKSMAKFIFVVGILFSVILAIVLFVNSENVTQVYMFGNYLSWVLGILGLITLIGGIIASVLFSFVLYAYGSIVEKYLNEKEQRIGDSNAQNGDNSQDSYINENPQSIEITEE